MRVIKMSNLLDNFLEFLATDGEWHTFIELTTVLGQNEKVISLIARFFSRYNFLQFRVNEGEVKIDSKMRDLIDFTIPERMPIVVRS